MQYHLKTQLKVGIFVMAALVVGGILVFAIGNRSHLFTRMIRYRLAFTNVGGLATGSPVRLGGVQVGDTKKVHFDKRGRVIVEIAVTRDTQSLIRETSVATLGTKGLLGDRVVDISAGTGRILPENAWIASKSATDISGYLQKADGIIADVSETARSLKQATKPLGDPAFAENIKRSAAHMATILDSATHNNSLVGRLFNDPQLATSVVTTVDSLKRVSSELEKTSTSAEAISRRIKEGPGLMHSMIYGIPGSKLPDQLGNLSDSLATLIQKVMKSDSAARELLIGQDSGDLVRELKVTLANLRSITDQVRKGQGTLGALVTDPSLYEDVKRLVGDLERNEILRALVRHSIRNDERGGKAAVLSSVVKH